MSHTKNNRRRYRNDGETIRFRNQLLYAKENNIPVDICGVSCADKRPYEVMRVMETGNYMVDYEGDNLGKIVAIHIDNVKGNK